MVCLMSFELKVVCSVELILVEWNPAPNLKPYSESFRMPKNLASLRFIFVPKG